MLGTLWEVLIERTLNRTSRNWALLHFARVHCNHKQVVVGRRANSFRNAVTHSNTLRRSVLLDQVAVNADLQNEHLPSRSLRTKQFHWNSQKRTKNCNIVSNFYNSDDTMLQMEAFHRFTNVNFTSVHVWKHEKCATRRHSLKALHQGGREEEREKRESLTIKELHGKTCSSRL